MPMSHAICLDSLLNLPAMGIPVVNYSPESTWEFGAAAQGYFRLPNQERTSIVQLDGTYSLKNQWYINAQGTLYFGVKNNPIQPHTIPHHITLHAWQLQFRAGYSDRPATYYGIYNDPHFANEGNMGIGLLRKGTPYQLQRGYLNIQTPIYLNQQFAIGPMLDMLVAKFDIAGQYTTVNPLVQVALGAVALYDSRDNVFYPNKGIFFKLSASAAWTNKVEIPAGQQATINGLLAADLRQYISLPHNLIVAWQLKTQLMLSEYDISHLTLYPMLPRLGGQDGLRGIHSDMFRDDIMMALQAELRIPIWSVFRGTVFAGIGDVYDYHNWHWAIPKVGYGMGLRATINKAKVNIRFDVARSNVNPRWDNINAYSFYLTATEAF